MTPATKNAAASAQSRRFHRSFLLTDANPLGRSRRANPLLRRPRAAGGCQKMEQTFPTIHRVVRPIERFGLSATEFDPRNSCVHFAKAKTWKRPCRPLKHHDIVIGSRIRVDGTDTDETPNNSVRIHDR